MDDYTIKFLFFLNLWNIFFLQREQKLKHFIKTHVFAIMTQGLKQNSLSVQWFQLWLTFGALTGI